MASNRRKNEILALAALFFGMVAARFLFARSVVDGVAFAFAAIALFRVGRATQSHAVGVLRSLRVDVRTLAWFAGCVAFWYSTVVWVWWSRRTPTFPLFLLDADLEPALYFHFVPVFVFLGLALERGEPIRPD